MAEPMEVVLIRAALITFQTPHCTVQSRIQASKDSTVCQLRCFRVPRTPGMAPESGAEARKDMPGHDKQ